MRKVFIPHTLDELWGILEEEPKATLYAGGTDLLVKLRILESFEPLICLEGIEEINNIKETGNTVFIGASATHAQLAANPVIQRAFPVLVRALRMLGSPPIRNMGTIGGNICTASPAGDTLPPLYTLGAVVEIRSIDSSRLMPLQKFIRGPGNIDLQKGEILYGLWVATNQSYTVHHYEKVGQRKALAIAIASLSALLSISCTGIIEKARLAWGSVAPTIVTSHAIDEILIGKSFTEETLRMAVPLVEQAVSPIGDFRASAEYRRMVAKNLLFRLLQYRKIW
jgi:CO/xanthine dehydrogenase FAD-binding subunit